MEEERIMEIRRGEKPKIAECSSSEENLDLTAGSPLEIKINNILAKVSVMEGSMTKLTGLLEGGVFGGRTKTGKE